jgi:predicted CxxxxCH...CXXCH cytochrome family protein
VNFGCAECHAKTVSSNTGISNVNNHGNGFVDFSGVRAGKSTSYSSATGQCTATYCHTDGKGLQKMTAANNWKSGATLGCKSCHGSDPNAGSFASAAGEPNYSSTGSGLARANSHQKHVASASDCGNCHGQTTTNGTAILANTNHLNGTATLVAGNGKSFSWTSNSKQCSNNGCHGNATWGGTMGCVNCHAGTITRTKGRPGTTLANAVGEFGLAWGHKKSGRAAVTDADCIVCHLEGDSTTQKTSPTYHQNGNIDLRDPDGMGEAAITNMSGAAFTFQRFSTSYAAGTRTTTGNSANTIDNVITQKFCLKCHDSNGATNTAARSGTAPTQYLPFGTGSQNGATYTVGLSAGVVGGVVDVNTQFATTNSSFHPVRGPLNRDFPYSTRLAAPYDNIGTSRNANNSTTRVKALSVVINCFDCHNKPTTPLTTRTVTAHGNATSLRGTVFANPVTLCIVCHTGYDTAAAMHGTGSAFPSGGNSGMLTAMKTQCHYCHSSDWDTTTIQRPVRGQDYHGYNAFANGTALWPTRNSRPYAFIRNTKQFAYHAPAVSPEYTGTASCSNGTTRASGCGSMSSYTPGGSY